MTQSGHLRAMQLTAVHSCKRTLGGGAIAHCLKPPTYSWNAAEFMKVGILMGVE